MREDMILDIWRAVVSSVVVIVPVAAALAIALLNRIIRRLDNGMKSNEKRDTDRQELLDIARRLEDVTKARGARVSDSVSSVRGVSPSSLPRPKAKQVRRKTTRRKSSQ